MVISVNGHFPRKSGKVLFSCPDVSDPKFTASSDVFTLPETKIDPWKRRFLLETTISRGELLVSGRVPPPKKWCFLLGEDDPFASFF